MSDEAALEKRRARGLRRAVLAQLFGILGMDSFNNGIMLLYMTVLGVNPVRILTYLAIPNALSTVFRLPIAYLADRYGKKRLGLIGLFLVTLGYSAVPFAGSFSLRTAEALLVSGFTVLAVGKMLFACGWFAMLSPLVPEDRRGRIFASMRFLFQTANIAVAGICVYALSENAPVSRFQVITGVLAFGFLMRAILYNGVPELERQRTRTGSFSQTLGKLVRLKGYAGFCAYIFLLTLFTAGCGSLFALVEKNTLALSSGWVVLLANIGMVGGMFGLFLGGRAIDRWGTKYVFMICHFGFGAGILGFLMRSVMPFPLLAALGGVHFFLGSVAAASGLAIISEMLALIPKENKALSTSIGTSMILAGSALSGLMSAAILKADIVRENWALLGKQMSQYDAILLAHAVMIVLMVVTLGLVPSVLRKAEWMPQAQ